MTCISPVIDWSNANVPAGSSIFVQPAYKNYPLMLRAGKAVYAWQLDDTREIFTPANPAKGESPTLELLDESAVEERLAETAGVILAGPVRAAGALADPALNCVVSDPDGDPPDVLIQIWFSISGRCQYCGATSMTT